MHLVAYRVDPKLPCRPVCRSRSAMPPGARPDVASSTRELRRANKAGLHRDVGEVRGGDGLLAAIYRRREAAEHSDDYYHETAPSLRKALALATLTK